MNKETGGQAFPGGELQYDSLGAPIYAATNGMTLREYAAIEFRIPDSGVDWLDEMIAKAERRDIAVKAMQGMMSNSAVDVPPVSVMALAYEQADAMLPGARPGNL